MESLEYGIKALVSPTNANVDIVAIHGLDGHREETWTAENGVIWLQHLDFLPKMLPRARILTYGYNAYTHGTQELSRDFLSGHSNQLLNLLSLYRQLDSTERRPIIFICHSLGGLLLKTALITANTRHAGHLQEQNDIIRSTYGILFMGTPQMGMNTEHLQQYLLDLRTLSKPTNDILLPHLAPGSEALVDQLNRYTDIQDLFVTRVYYEMYPTPMSGSPSKMIVGKDSASVPGTPNMSPCGLHKNHVTLVRFGSQEDNDYRTVAGHLFLMARDSPYIIGRAWKDTPASPTVHPSATISWELPVGRYRIQNSQSKAFAALRDSTAPSYLISFIGGLGLVGGDVWEVRQLANSGYTIQNVDHKTYAAPSVVSLSEGDKIVGKPLDKYSQWVIKGAVQKGRYTISPAGYPELYWHHSDFESEALLTFHRTPTHPRNHWLFVEAP